MFLTLHHRAAGKRIGFLALCLLFFLGAGTAQALELALPAVQVAAKGEAALPVVIDRVDNLAGLKLVFSYDPKRLHFQRLTKSRQTAGLMHVVNANTPGKVVVVMAGARGIKGENFPLATLHFTATGPAGVTEVTITHWELMSDTLKPLTATVRHGTVTITGGGNDNP